MQDKTKIFNTALNLQITGKAKEALKLYLKLIKGNSIVVGRRSPYSKYNLSLVSFDEAGDYDQKDAEGFIKITSLRLKK